MSQVVSQALPPVPQVPLQLYGNQAYKSESFISLLQTVLVQQNCAPPPPSLNRVKLYRLLNFLAK